MALTQFRKWTPREDTIKLVEFINSILHEYNGQRLTARQVYYRLVAADIIPNNDKSYKRLTSLLTDARYAGLVDWDIIEDRGRVPQGVQEWSSIQEIVSAAMHGFCLPRWEGQDNYVEVWVEKQALAGVLWPICRKWHTTLMVNKGYSSASAMKESADRIMEACGQERRVACDNCDAEGEPNERGWCDECLTPWTPKASAEPGHRTPYVLYLGDHDPSGEDMVRDVETRLVEFGVTDLIVEKVGLTMDQIRELKPPPNPAKITDSRAADYIAKYGNKSWELDALPPKYLNQLVDGAIAALCDTKLVDKVRKREDEQRKHIEEAMRFVKEPSHHAVVDFRTHQPVELGAYNEFESWRKKQQARKKPAKKGKR